MGIKMKMKLLFILVAGLSAHGLEAEEDLRDETEKKPGDISMEYIPEDTGSEFQEILVRHLHQYSEKRMNILDKIYEKGKSYPTKAQ